MTIIIDKNSWFPRSLSPAKCSIASACNNPSDNNLKYAIWEQFDYYNQKQNKVLYVNMEYMDFLPPTSVLSARLTWPNVAIQISKQNQKSRWSQKLDKFPESV